MHRPRRGRRQRVEDERGASVVIVAVVMSVLLVAAAFAVDIGMQRVGRSDMQALADVVALDLARHLDGRSTSALTTELNTERDRSVARHDADYGSTTPNVTYQLGSLSPGGTFVPGTDPPSAVQVTASTTVGFVFGGLTGTHGGGAQRQATAIANGGACFAIGSYAARLDTGASPLLGPLLGALGSNVTLSAIDYNGLANTNVELLDLLGASIGAGTIESVLNSSVSLGSFYVAIAHALDGQSTAQAQLLQTIAASVGAAQVNLGDILGVTTGAGSGLTSDLNVLDLVTAAAAAANGTNAISVPNLGLSLPPLANLQASLSAIEAPRIGCGRKNDAAATAKSTQVTLNVSTTAADVSVPNLLKTNVSLSGTVNVAQAIGRLTDVRCNPAGITVAVSDGLLGIDLTLNVTVSAKVLGITIPVVTGPIHISGTSHSAGDAVVNITQDSDYDHPVTVGYDNPGLPNLTVDTSGLHLIGLPVGIVLGPIVNALTTGLVNPLIDNLSSSLVEPLLHTLGADLSGADVYARRTPQCAVPRLVQ
ncbi:TadG family pilus assembly protein [Nocardioides panacisoli]|uniref:DUF2134 domain-containing protein n=1 Tax=Nocardioides panacisoli TaxID=627624 RepID=A0ABP7HWQ4_9ACTN